MQNEYLEGFSAFYYLMICADGVIDERELQWGKKMMQAEQINETRFNSKVEQFNQRNLKDVYNICINALKKCSTDQQLKCIAWMSVIANADGFMAPKEWQLLYDVYSRELNLDLKNILKLQSELQGVYSNGAFII